MKKTLIAIVAVSLLAIASCTKSNTTSSGGGGGQGNWTFQGSTNTATTCTLSTSGRILTASNLSKTDSSNYSTLAFTFSTSTVAAGLYSIANSFSPPTTGNYVIVTATTGLGGTGASQTFTSTGGDHLSLNVMVNANNKLTFTIPSIEVINYLGAAGDSAAVTNIMLTQQ